MAENRGPQVAGVTILFLVLAWVFVCLRCYVRVFMIKNFGKDDLLSVFSLVFFSLYCAFVLLGVKYGTGQHLQDIPPENIPIAIKWWWCCELAYVSCTALVKTSISIFLMRICIARSQRIAIWVVIVMTVVYSILYFFVIVFQCSPTPYFWTQYLGATGSCLDPGWITNTTYTHSAISVAADWTLGLLPVFLLWDLEMNPRTKISVGLILSLGAIGSTATIVRIPYIKDLANRDFLYSTTDVAIWSTVEPGIGLTASGMATLRPLFRSFLARSKVWGGSTPHDPSIPPSKSSLNPWPSHPRAKRKSYIRSSSNTDLYAEDRMGDMGDLEIALRGDLRQGTGTVTTVSAVEERDDDQSDKGERAQKKGNRSFFRSERSLEGREDDSSEEILTDTTGVQAKNPEVWEVRKTTEVRMDERSRKM